MIEQYIYNKILQDETLKNLLKTSDGKGIFLFPSVIPREIEDFEKAVTFTLITTVDDYPTILSHNIQFSIFAKKHSDTVNIAKGLYNLFNEANNQKDGDVKVVFSIRVSETDLGFDFDTYLYQRESTYYFKIR